MKADVGLLEGWKEGIRENDPSRCQFVCGGQLLSEFGVVGQVAEAMPPCDKVDDCSMEGRVPGQFVVEQEGRVDIVEGEGTIKGVKEWDVVEEKSPDPVVGAVALRGDVTGRPSIDIQRLYLVRNGRDNLRSTMCNKSE